MDIDLKPIGSVSSSVREAHANWGTVISEIIVNEDLQDALERIEGFSHIVVLYWMHKLPRSRRSVRRVHPRGKQDLPLVGVLATRSPARPNPIGVTTVELVQRRGNVLTVRGLDALDGTPVLDIKPHIRDCDLPVQARTPEWAT